MGSKMVLDRQKSSTFVDSAGTKFEDKMVASMVAVLGPEAGPATRTLLNLATAKLRSDTAAMVSADAAHLDETSDDSQKVALRDEKRDVVRTMLMDIREAGETVYGSDFVRLFGFQGDTPTDPVMVESLGNQVVQKLSSPSLQAAKPLKLGLTMDLGVWREPLSAALLGLKQSIRDVVDDTRSANQTLVTKQRTMSDYDRTFSTTADLVSHLLRTAGEDELSRRVRPSTRKPGQTVEENEPEPEIEPTPAQ